MAESPVLVAGASGQLGGAIARKLLAAGTPIRALARRREGLEPLVKLGAEAAAVDLLNLGKLSEACRGVSQIIATVNNNMGKGPTSPAKVDMTAYQNLCAAARKAGVRRIVYVSYRGVVSDAAVDIFRIKWKIEDAIKRSEVPYVFMRPTSFMDIWIDRILADGIRKKKVTEIFGDGTAIGNYIAVDDVAEFGVRILARPEIVKEAIEIGGPSDLSLNDLATLIERRLGASGKRRHIPVALMKILVPVIKPFNEVTSRLISLGLYAATESQPFPKWREAAQRFGVEPRTVEQYLANDFR